MSADLPRRTPLAAETGFWRKIDERGALRKSDVFRLREDLSRLEKLVAGQAPGGAPANLVEELQHIRHVMATDYGTQSLIIQTLIEVLLDKGVMTEDEFEDKMDAIDARDGKKDGTLGGHEFGSGEGI